jgi:hypothetical protein
MQFFARLARLSSGPRLLGLGSLVAALACAGYLLFGFGYSYETVTGSAGTDGVVVSVTTTQGWENALAFARQNHDYAIVGWAGFVVVLGVLTALAAWRGRPGPVWAAALLLLVLSVLGLASIGLVVAPVALLVALTAFALRASRPRGRPAP